jgi:hypothetical protein
MFRGHSVGAADGGSVAVSPRRGSLTVNLLAAAKAVGRGGIWLNAWRTLLGALDAKGLLKWDEAFLDGSFAPAKKWAMQSAKPSEAKAQSGWNRETVKVFRWEFGWKVPLRQKLRLRTPRSTRSAFPGRKVGRGRSQNG